MIPQPASSETATPAPVPARRSLWRLSGLFNSVCLVGGLALLVYVVSRYPLIDLGRACAQMGPGIAVTLVIALGWHACSAGALFVLLDGRVPWRTLLWTRLAAEGYNSLLVGVGGEPFRVRFLSRFVPSEQVVAVLIRDRVIDLASGYLVSALFLAVGISRFALQPAIRGSLAAYAAVVVIVSIAATALVLTHLPIRVGGVLVRWLGGSATTPPAPLPLGTFLRVLPWYLTARLLGLAEIGTLLWLLGLGFDPWKVGFIDGFLNAAGTLSFMVPQSVGVFEGASVFLFATFGFPGPAGVVFGLVRRARMLAISLSGVALHWLGREWRAKVES